MRIWDKESALKGLLKRVPLEEYPIPQNIRSKIKEVFGSPLSPPQVVDIIISEVRERGDEAILRLVEKIDGFKLDKLEVSPQEIDQAIKTLNTQFLSALKTAAERIRLFHEQIKPPQIPNSLLRPLKKVGIYIPARYFSTVLMTVIPAKVAGVNQVILTTPARDGKPSPYLLAAARISGADRVFKIGGAQGIAALALGTQSIPKVDKVCGPGNIFVQLAKKKLYGIVDIDGIYGPSEIMIISDPNFPYGLCAVEILAQLEHDPLSSAILITTNKNYAEMVLNEIERKLKSIPESGTITQALKNSGIVVVDSIEEGIELANLYAPEHLLILSPLSDRHLGMIENAGSITIGMPVALLDYILGPSHVLPTGGTARFFSPLNPLHFLKISYLNPPGKEEIKDLIFKASVLADAEGMYAHLLSLKSWLSYYA